MLFEACQSSVVRCIPVCSGSDPSIESPRSENGPGHALCLDFPFDVQHESAVGYNLQPDALGTPSWGPGNGHRALQTRQLPNREVKSSRNGRARLPFPGPQGVWPQQKTYHIRYVACIMNDLPVKGTRGEIDDSVGTERERGSKRIYSTRTAPSSMDRYHYHRDATR